MYHLYRHPKGPLVATARMPQMASVCVGVWVGVGGRYEPAELCGVSHFIEHLLFKGTRKRSARQISEEIEGMGGDMNAYTCEENTCFFSKARHDRFTELLAVLMDMLFNSQFDPVELEKEREVIKEELAMYLDQPQQYVLELLNETLWPDHPLGRSVTGTEQTIASLQRDNILAFQKAHYVLGNILITVAGNLDHQEVNRAVSKYARFFQPGVRSRFQPVTMSQSQPQVRLFSKEVEQTQVALGIRACSRHDERRFALRLLSTLLGENMSSRLFQVIREDHGLAYSIGSSIGLFDDVGALTISAGLDTDNLAATLKLLLRELHNFTATPPSPAELRRARDYLIGQLDLNLESTSNHMMWIGEQIMGYGKVMRPDEIKQRLAEIKPTDIRNAARDFFKPEYLSLALVSPLKSPRGLKEMLKIG